MTQTLMINGQPVTIDVQERKGHSLRFVLGGKEYSFSGERLADGSFVITQETAKGCYLRVTGFADSAGRQGNKIQLGALEAVLSEQMPQSVETNASARLAPLAPMPGMVRQVMVSEGDEVKAGQPLVVVEAMKLQLTLSAGGDAKVERVLVAAGQMVAEGAELVKLVAA